MSEHDPNVSSALLEVILGATEGHELIAAHDFSFIVVGVLWCSTIVWKYVHLYDS